jgi:molybdate transport system ATP-binding protein
MTNSRSTQAAADLHIQVALKRSSFALDVDLCLPAHGITAIFGASGSGKTTLLRCIAGFETGSEAGLKDGLESRATCRISLQGEVWQDSAQGIFKPTHQRGLGYVFQEASLFDHLNVADNLKFGFKRTPAALRKLGWDQTVELLGISHLLTRWPQQLSGGERQRVAIARALAASPQMLLMDEPLASLDAARKADILPYLESLHREMNIPIIYVSHAIDEVARLADHLVLLVDGKTRASGRTNELLTRLDLPLAHGDMAGAVLETTVLSHDVNNHLSTVAFKGGTLAVPMSQAAIGQMVRVRVQARDVSLTLTKQTGTSILNILSAKVTALSPDSPGQLMVALDVGVHGDNGTATVPLLARITARSANALGLELGSAVYAQIKGVAILG